MILKSIMAIRFRGIKKEDLITFFPGLNIVKGSDNEAGKSSLRIAITKALFQDPTSTSEDVRKLTSWGTDEPWEIELEFQVNAAVYQLSKSLRDRTCKLVCKGSQERPITNKNAITTKVTELMGCPSEVFFESTACIGQDELIRIIPPSVKEKGADWQKAYGPIAQRLQATLSGAEGVDVPAILAKLYSKTHNKPAKGPYYYLSNIQEPIEGRRSEKTTQEIKVNGLMEKRRELNRAREQLKQINNVLPSKQGVLEKNNRILQLEADIARDTKQYGDFERARGFKKELESADEQLGREFACFSGREADIAQLKDAKHELGSLGEQKISRQNELKALEGQKPALWARVLGIAFLVSGLVSGLAGLVIGKYLYFGFAVAAAGLLLLGYFWLIPQIADRRKKDYISNELKTLESKIQIKEDLVKSVLNSFGFQDYDKYERQHGDYETKLRQRNQLFDKLSGILGDKNWENFEAENSGLAIKVTANQDELKKLLPFKLKPLELQKLEIEVNGLGGLVEQKRDLEGKKVGLDNFFVYTDADTDQLASAEEELERLEQERKFWERKQKVFETTRQVLEEAHKQALSRAANVLEKELGRYISIITDSRYIQVRINEKDLSIQTFSPEKQDWVNVSELSRATQDQFYICARFALVNLITEGKKPPLLLDDPFVNFHPKRLKRTIPLLQELAKENQILLFTCSDTYDNYGNKILLE